MGAHTVAKLEDILQAIVERIIDQVAGFTEANCYLSIDPNSTPEPNPGQFVCVVAPTSGAFDEAKYDGGGEDQATINGGVVVKLHSPLQLDQPHRDGEFLRHTTLGVLRIWREIVKSLIWPWQLQIGDDDGTRDPLIPADYTFERRSRKLAAIEQTFKVNFDLDLT